MLNLTPDNYYSLEADSQYMSYSQYKNFIKCESMGLAIVRGEHKPKPSKSMLMGSYVDAAIEGDEALEKLKKETPELFLKGGTNLKSEFVRAQEMVWAILHDPLMERSLDGEKQAIRTAQIDGIPWKCKMDVLNPKKERITDLKTAANLNDKYWDIENRCYIRFIEYYGYVGQMALYREIERLSAGRDYYFDVYLTIVTSEDPPDKAVITISPDRLEDELNTIKNNIPRIIQVKNELVNPTRCERCEWCRKTKVLERVMDLEELI